MSQGYVININDMRKY